MGSSEYAFFFISRWEVQICSSDEDAATFLIKMDCCMERDLMLPSLVPLSSKHLRRICVQRKKVMLRKFCKNVRTIKHNDLTELGTYLFLTQVHG